ncbi:TonB-dependent receptor [Flavivirga spongiicola]|uniref:TonB-dependent receptor n=1 Tax=Flavivirga spongiicola TaxID=421621 RepID=A0ABU7XLX1_9FLAO|nr:TonB-dependent receptor [Flavivirga sp. MEBiC05379]MDO5981421.1 TonB-dependent receptor [Flavivirga sp. MEBiC05379]
MIKKLLLLLTIIFSATFVYGQRGKIKGKVISRQGYEIANANISIKKTGTGTMTNSFGDYLIENIKSGNYTLKVTFVGYKSEEVLVLVKSNQTTNVPTITLLKGEEKLDEILVEGHKKNKYSAKTPSRSLRLKTEIVNLPQNVQIINNDLLVDQQVTSMMDGVIRNVSGVTMLEHWGHFARINMRGFRLPAFRNGFNVSDTWGPLSEDMSLVESVEFVKGPSGFMLSAGEPGGFYNVVTKKPVANKIANISLTTGSFDFYRGALDLGGKLTENGKLLYRFNAMYQTNDSHRGGEDVERFAIAPGITYNFSEKTSLTTEANIEKAESLIGSAYVFAPVADGYGSLDRDFKFLDTNYPETDINQFTSFTNFKHEFSKYWSFETQFAYLRYEQDGNSAWASITETGDATRFIYDWDALSLGKYFQTYVNGKFNTGSISHTILAGFDYTDKNYWADFTQAPFVVDSSTPFNIYNPIYGNTEIPSFDTSDIRNRNGGTPYNGFVNRSVYLQDEIGFANDKIRLTLAGRYTNLSTVGKNENDAEFTPRVGVSADVLPSLKVYALYDQSFLPQNGRTSNEKPVNPVEAIDVEGGIKKIFFDGRLKAALGVYQITKENIAFTDPGDNRYVLELGEVQSKGIEFDLQGEITPELNVVLNYANTNVEVTKDINPDNVGNRIAGHAKHITNGWLNYNFVSQSKLKGLGLSLGYQYQVDRSSWAWGADNETDLPDYFRLDGGLSWQNDAFRIQVNLNNILDEYLYSGANYGSYLYWQSEPGINGKITLTYKF